MMSRAVKTDVGEWLDSIFFGFTVGIILLTIGIVLGEFL